ncbi:LamB/YcsF family protein [Pseudomonas fluorescens]|uniref:5-oxoprolinase subunit A n=1 Tax=Pseudomonas fluorescens TaxID=294 RepID=A0A327NIW1_PSEFL|nr:5-oxoprolinase subunit PxpA [Pseudomonas fluorescens]RAI72488.1 LamB/YcsF family protein [Pseudomonas fluorescens]
MISLNCDMGESYGAWRMGLDEEIMPLIDCANIACGFHAGDPSTLRRTVALAKQHDVKIGAHPAYPDMVGFGRRSMACSAAEIQDMLHYQVGALQGICVAEGAEVEYIKPHGALYNDMMNSPEILEAVVSVAARHYLHLVVLARSDNSAQRTLAEKYGVEMWFESFADRAYYNNGNLVSRSLPGSVYKDADQVIAQALSLARGEALVTLDGTKLSLESNTICVHGDNPASVSAVRRIRDALQSNVQ